MRAFGSVFLLPSYHGSTSSRRVTSYAVLKMLGVLVIAGAIPTEPITLGLVQQR